MSAYRKVRKADLPRAHRDLFERYGESVIQTMIAASHAPRAKELSEMYSDQAMIENAGNWLTERADISANRELRLEIVEWAILVFVIVGVAVDLWPILWRH